MSFTKCENPDCGCVYQSHIPTRAEAAIQRVRDLHQPFAVVGECTDDSHPSDDYDFETHLDTGYYEGCLDNKLYDICTECCLTRFGDQSEECADQHDHGPDKHICRTRACLSTIAESLAGAE